jgi:small subunit ribosomal protein S6
MIRQYESIFILDSHLSGDQIESNIEKYSKYIQEGGGGIKFIDRLGKRRLAYEIAKKQYGYYVHIRFEADGSFIRELGREFRLNDAVLRHLTVLVPKLLVEEELKGPDKNDKSSEQSNLDGETTYNNTDSEKFDSFH